jgi:hypothetical protein
MKKTFSKCICRQFGHQKQKSNLYIAVVSLHCVQKGFSKSLIAFQAIYRAIEMTGKD